MDGRIWLAGWLTGFIQTHTHTHTVNSKLYTFVYPDSISQHNPPSIPQHKRHNSMTKDGIIRSIQEKKNYIIKDLLLANKNSNFKFILFFFFFFTLFLLFFCVGFKKKVPKIKKNEEDCLFFLFYFQNNLSGRDEMQYIWRKICIIYRMRNEMMPKGTIQMWWVNVG